MSKYIDNLDDCLLEVFRKVLKSHDYKLLLISGQYDEEEGHQEWLKLYDLYNNSIKSHSVNLQFETTKQIEIKKNDFMLIQNCLFAIETIYQINIIGELSEEFEPLNYDEYIKLINSYSFRFDESKGIIKELQRVKKQSKVYLSNIESEIKKLEKQNESSKNWDFDNTIGAIEKFMGYPMPENITVKRFTVYLNMLIDSQQPKPEK